MTSQWEACVVGINYYPSFTGLLPLTAAAKDAEAIAAQLKQYGYQTFRVQRLPRKGSQGGEWQVDPDEGVKSQELEESLRNLLTPPDNNSPETALFFFSGHGWQRSIDGKDEVFLVTSDALPTKKNYGITISSLGQLIQESQAKKIIVWLDCCFSGELTKYLPDNKDYCIFTATRSYEPGIEIQYQEGLFTQTLREGLNPDNYADGIVDSHRLAKFIQERMAQTGQAPQCFNSVRSILLTSKAPPKTFVNQCPYRSLFYFSETLKDAQVFYGRTKLTQVLVEHIGKQDRFLAVFGASGSGKSSLIRAGLLYQLKLGQAIPGSNNWIYLEPFAPTNDPLARLYEIIAKSDELAPIFREFKENQSSNQENKIFSQELADLFKKIGEVKTPIILIIDQFEECFSMGDQEKTTEFITLLTELIQTLPSLYVIIGMRSDFRGRLREFPDFSQAIMAKMNVEHLNREEIEEAIAKPAEFVGLGIESSLKQQLINDVEDYPGSLPLLQYTLTELWHEARKQGEQFLRLQTYQDLGGIEGTLEKRADAAYASLLPQEQTVAKRIFLELTQVGDRLDTRRRISLGDLANSHHSLELLDTVTSKLANQENRLITRTEISPVSENSQQSEIRSRLAPLKSGENATSKIIIDVVHGALIRHWQRLVKWKEEYKDSMVIERRIEAFAQDWEKGGRKNEELYPASKLEIVDVYLKEFGEWGMLDGIAEEFIYESIRHRNPIRRFTDIFSNRQKYSQLDNSNVISKKITEEVDDSATEDFDSDNIEIIEEEKDFDKIDEEEDIEDIDSHFLSSEDCKYIAQSFKNDLAQGSDLLNIENELYSLAEVLIMRDLQPPLAVGICGGWGSGKSYAMHLIQKKITEIRCLPLKKTQVWGGHNSNKSRLSLHVGHIYQIRFDAWTFAKANLWSSLMQTIFYEFNRQLTLEKQLEEVGVDPLEGGDIWKALDVMSDEEREALLDSKLSSDVFKKWKDKASESNTGDWLWDTLTELRQEEKENLKKSENELSCKRLKLQKKRKNIEDDVKHEIDIEASKAYWKPLRNQLDKLMGTAFTEFVKQAKQELKKTTEESETEQEAKLLKKTLELFRPTIWEKLCQVIRINWKTFLAFIFFLILTIATPFLLDILNNQIITYWTLLLTLVPLTPSLKFAKQLWKKWIRLQRELEEIFKCYQKQLKTEQDILKNSFEDRVNKKCQEKEIVNIEREIKKLEAQVERQKQRIGLTASYISLSDFIDTRLEEDFYGKKLGFMQQVQRDLIDLTAHFVVPDESNGHKLFFDEKKKHLKQFFPRGSARVILYIDDLDRCPPHRVVEVLEAVQLLLKTPLFVVVLAIDDRYIARALEKEYQGILKRGGKPSGIDYIEKIIQVSYRMRPIPKSAIDKYLMSHMDIEESKQQEEPEEISETSITLSATDFFQPEEEPEEISETPVTLSATDLSQSEEEPEKISETPVILSATDLSQSEEEPEKISETPVILSATDLSQSEEEPEEISEIPVTPSATDLSQDKNKDQTSSIADNKPRDLPFRVKKFTHKEFNILRDCCEQVDLSPRTVKRLINIYKIMKIIWFREENFGKNEVELRIKKTIIACLALSGRYPHLMRNAFAELDNHFEEARDLDKKLVEIFLIKDNEVDHNAYLKREWSKFCYDVNQLIGDVTLEEISLRNFHLLLSFSFVGDLGYDPEDFRPTRDKGSPDRTVEVDN